MSRLFDLQCNPQIVNGALGEVRRGAARIAFTRLC